MKKLLLGLSILAQTISGIYAQQTTFRIDYDVALFDIPVTSIESLTPNNYLFSGIHANFIPLRSSLSEVDATGALVWGKTYTSGFAFTFGDVKKDDALNQYYACGGGETSGPAFLLLMDAAGNVTTARNFSIAEADGAYFNRVIKTSDGGYLCVGSVTGYDPDGAGPEVKFNSVTNNDGSCDQPDTEQIQSPLIVKFDSNGNHVWHRVFRYYVTSAIPANRIYNDASFVDLVEVSDGYIAIGNYDVNNVFSTFNTDCEDTTPTDAFFLKTTTAGAITYHRQIDNPSNSTSQSSKSLVSAEKTTAGEPLISGTDGSGRPCLLMRLPSSGGWASPPWIRKYGVPIVIFGIPTGGYHPFIPSRFFEAQDGNYALWANYFEVNFPSVFCSALVKVNPSNNSVIWARQHLFNFASFLPHGQAVSDGGYIGLSYTLSGAGHDMHFIKTDANGNASVDCPSQNFSLSSEGPSYTYGTPIYNSWNANTVTNGSFTPTVSNITPGSTVQCITVVTECTPPSAPTTVTATPNPICPGDNTTISASGPSDPNVNYNVYTASTGGTNLGATPLVVSPGSTTSYWVEAVDNTDPLCVSVTRTEVIVTVNQAPTASNAGNDQSVCGTSATLAGNAPAVGSGQWTVISGTGNFANAGSPTSGVTGLSPGANVFQWTITNAPCTPSSDQVTITSVSVPTAANAGNDQSICATSTSLEGNVAASGSGQWTVISGSGTFTDATNPTTNVTGLGVGANVFQWTISNAPCTASSDQVTITNTGGPTTADAGSDESVCGTSATLAGNTPAVGSGQWTVISGTGNFADAGSPTSGVTGLSPGANVFQWTITNAPCTPSSDQVTITSVSAPTAANAGNDQSICATSTSLEGNVAASGSGQWTVISGSGTFTDATNPTTNVTGLGVGANVFQWTISNAPCTASSDQVTITNTGGPTTADAGSDESVCGTSATLAGNAPAVGTGQWTVISGTGNFADAGSPTSGVTGLSPGANVFQWTISNDPCTPSSDQVTITSVSAPTASVAGDDQILCATSTSLTANTPTSGAGQWTVVSGTGSFADPTNPTTTVTGLSVGDNIFEWTISNPPCAASSDQVTITNTGGPSVNLISVDDASCFGDSDGVITVEGTGGAPGYTYSWAPAGGNNATTTPLPAGDYTVTVTDNVGCTDDLLVTINEPTELDLTMSSTPSSCATADGTATVVANGGDGNYTYLWSPSGSGTATATNLGAGNHSVTVTDGNGCQATDNVNVTLSDGPVITVESVNDVSCFGGNDGSAEISAVGGSGNYTYSWSPSGGNTEIATDLTAGSYTVTVSDDSGCEVSENITIDTPSQMSVIETVTNATCTGDDGNISLAVSGGTTTYTYLWSPGGEITSSITGNAGDYTVTITDAQGCELQENYTIGLTNNLNATITPDDITITGGESVQLEVTLDPDAVDAVYSWTPPGGLNCTDCPNPIASPSETTTYIVAVSSGDGCYDTSMVTVFVTLPCGDLFMPTIFSPNSDGLNDELCLLGDCIVELDLKIYDRWGELVFETTTQDNCWDGSYRGKPMNSAVFVYKLFVRTSDGTEIEESGNVNLVR